MIGYAHDLNTEIPGYAKCTSLLRSAESRTTSRSLMIVAVICLLRASLMPWIIHYAGIRTLNGPSDVEIVACSILCMTVMAMLSLWAKFAPFAAALIAVLCFGSATAYDVLHYAQLADEAMVSKVLIWIVLLRSMMNGIMSRTM